MYATLADNFEESKGTENGRCGSAEGKGKLKTWQAEFGGTPTVEQLIGKFGDFHYGWKHEKSVAETEKGNAGPPPGAM